MRLQCDTAKILFGHSQRYFQGRSGIIVPFQSRWVHENPLFLKEMPAFPCLGVAALRCGFTHESQCNFGVASLNATPTSKIVILHAILRFARFHLPTTRSVKRARELSFYSLAPRFGCAFFAYFVLRARNKTKVCGSLPMPLRNKAMYNVQKNQVLLAKNKQECTCVII